jgi:uncharacterized membrane protein YozB (DUF420 family)
VNGWVQWLPHCNALLNSIALLLLLRGYVLIRRRDERGHRRAMMATFATSVLFLASYVTYHTYLSLHGPEQFGRRFPEYPPAGVRYFYLGMLASHVVLAATVPFLAVASIYLGWRDRRAAHRRLVKWTFPVWLYVSITGILVYLMIYQIYPPRSSEPAPSAVSVAGGPGGIE